MFGLRRRNGRMTGKVGSVLVAALLGAGIAALIVPGETVERGAVAVVRAAADGAEGWLADRPIRGTATVSDGDTLRISGVKVRLFGIDAPELSQTCATGSPAAPAAGWRCGAAAAARLTELASGGDVSCKPRDHDRYGRIVAACSVNGVDLGAQLVAEGLARAYVRYGDDYAAAEAQARSAGVGLWQGAAEAPWDYRADRLLERAAVRRAEPQAEPGRGSGDCPIKGNVSAGGKRIYHLPGTRAYARTRIDPDRGEAWFCDEAAALAAGFRPPGD